MPGARFAAVGDNCVDRFRAPLNLSLIGGNAVNVAVQLATAGHDALYFGAVGRDVDGERTRDLLRANGVDVSHVVFRDAVTAFTDIESLPNGERVFAYEDFGACKGYRPDAAAFAALKTMRHVHIGWLDDGGDLRRALSADGVSVSQDVSVNASPIDLGIDGLSIAFASADDDNCDADAIARALLAGGAKLAVVTRGSLGSLATDGRRYAETGVKTVDVVDTTGAGDSFIAGFISAYSNGMPLLACLERGRDRAAFTCMHVGGFPQEPQPLP
jgi:fructoselysine 6-kinase